MDSLQHLHIYTRDLVDRYDITLFNLNLRAQKTTNKQTNKKKHYTIDQFLLLMKHKRHNNKQKHLHTSNLLKIEHREQYH